MKKLEITLNYTKNRKIPCMKNLAELLFKLTFPGKIKRIFKTYKGVKKTNKIK